MALDSFKEFDDAWELQHAVEIAFDQWKVNWEAVTPYNFVPVVASAIVWSTYNTMQVLNWKK